MPETRIQSTSDTSMEKYKNLLSYLSSKENVFVAFSGGVDSTLLLLAALEALGNRAVAIIMKTPFHTHDEIIEAERVSKELGAQQLTIDIDLLENEDVIRNASDRCYHCKLSLLGSITEKARRVGAAVLEGSTISDLSDHRPGMRAVEELGIESPLLKLGFTKDDVRLILKSKGVKSWDIPSNSCLAARIPYNDTITKEKLRSIQKAEMFLHDLGFSTIRVRHHGDLARVELDESELQRAVKPSIRRRIVSRLETLGFTYVALDLAGYRTGSMNRILNGEKDTNVKV